MEKKLEKMSLEETEPVSEANNNNNNNTQDINVAQPTAHHEMTEKELKELLLEIVVDLYQNLLQHPHVQRLLNHPKGSMNESIGKANFQKRYGLSVMEISEFKKELASSDCKMLRMALKVLLTVIPFDPSPEMTKKIERILTQERAKVPIVDAASLPCICKQDEKSSNQILSKIAIWRGDITTLKIGAIVNAANKYMLGCFTPNHLCIDNVIHAKAGPGLRQACRELMHKQTKPVEETGLAKITPAFQLPSQFVLHTVGPIVETLPPSVLQVAQLASCYRECMKVAKENNVRSIAFCCISTGVFGYPQKEACVTAFSTVIDVLRQSPDDFDLIVFNVFKPEDLEYYQDYAKNLLEKK